MDPKKKAREHLVAAEKHIKNSEFDLARNEVLKAQELDPSNVYTFAFLERIDFFKQQSSREEIVSPAASSQDDIVDNDKVEIPPETDDKEIIDEPPVPDTTETDESKETVDQEHSEDPIYLAILNSIRDYQNQLSELADRAKELRHYTDISPVIHKADSIKDRIKTARDGLSEYQDTELYSAHEKIILDVGDELKTLDEHIKSFQEPADDGTIAPSDQLSIISSLEEELADFSDTIRQRTDTYSEEDVREKLSGFERRLDELEQSMESNHLIENKFKEIQSLLDTVESKARTLSLPDIPEETSSQKNQYYEELARRVDDLQRSIASYDEIQKSTDELRSELSQLETQLQKLHEEVRSFPQPTSEYEEIREQIKGLSTQLEGTRQPLTALEQQLQQLQQDVGKSTEPPEHVENPDALRPEIDTLKSEIDRINVEVRNALQATSGLDELRGQINALTAYLDTIGEPLLDLEKKVQQLSQDIPLKEPSAGDTADLSEFQSEMNRLKGEIEKISDEVRNTVQSSTELDELRQQVRALSSRLEESGKPLSDLEQRVQQLSEDIGRKADLPDGIDDLSGFRSEMLLLKNELGKISGEVRDAREEITGVDELRKQIQSLTSYLEKIGEPLLDLEQRVQQLSEDIGRKANLPDGIDDLNEFRSEMLTLKNELGKISGEVHDAKKRVTEHDGLRVQISDLSSRLEASGKPLSDLEQRVQQLSEDIGRKANLPDGIDDLNEFRSEMLTLKNELGKVSGEVHDAKKRITEHDGLRQQIRDLSSRLEASGKPLSDLKQRVQQLTQDIPEISRKIDDIGKLENQIVNLQEWTNQLQGLPARIEDIIDVQQHLTGNYADLEQRLQDFILDGTNKFVGHEHVDNLKNDIVSLRKQMDEIATETAKKQDFQQAHSETISLHKDLEERIVTFIKKQSELRDSHLNELKEQSAALENQLSAIESESQSKQNDIENKLFRLTENSNALKLKLDYEIESLKASGPDRESYHKIEDRLKALEDKREKDLEDYQSTLVKMEKHLNTLSNFVETDQRKRRESEKRKLEIGLKYFKSAADSAWEHGAPDAERAAELQNLVDLFSIPESIEKEILHEVKLRKYSQAVKKAISDKKIFKKDGPSLEQLRQLYSITLEEYIEYESIFLDELISIQYHGTILVISDDTLTRDDLSERFMPTGFTVLYVSNPEIALERIDSVSPQVIICETTFRTTKYKGIDLLGVLRRNEKYNYLPFILIAEPYELTELKKGLINIHEAVVIKPVDFNDLLKTIDGKLKQVRDHLSSQTFE